MRATDTHHKYQRLYTLSQHLSSPQQYCSRVHSAALHMDADATWTCSTASSSSTAAGTSLVVFDIFATGRTAPQRVLDACSTTTTTRSQLTRWTLDALSWRLNQLLAARLALSRRSRANRYAERGVPVARPRHIPHHDPIGRVAFPTHSARAHVTIAVSILIFRHDRWFAPKKKKFSPSSVLGSKENPSTNRLFICFFFRFVIKDDIRQCN